MMFSISHSASLLAILLLACVSPSLSHTWVEEVRLIGANGSYVGVSGWVRDFIPRTSSRFKDTNAQNKIPPDGRSTGTVFIPTDMICRSGQTVGNQTPGFPALVAAPGDRVALRYLENGHVTLFTSQDGKPLGRGTVYVYGTTKPLATDTYLGIHKVWTMDGTGGDGRGKLIASQPFDDGQCFQGNSGPISTERQAKANWPANKGDLACQTDVVIPADVGTSGLYTLYWVWDWPTLDRAGNVFKNESYTSCIDVSLTSTPQFQQGNFKMVRDLKGLALQSAAAAPQVTVSSFPFVFDPTGPQKQAPDNPFTEPGSAPVPIPAATPTSSNPAVPATTPTTAPASPSVTTPAVVTVTVTEEQNFTVTVTMDAPTATTKVVLSNSAIYSENPEISTSSPTATTFTILPSTSTVDTSHPAVTPFLTPGNAVVQVAPRKVAIRGRPVNFMG